MDIVIGIGNEIRGDDGVGPHVVDAIPARADLETMTVHQLAPEIAEQIRQARRVLFVDSCLDCDEVQLTRVEASEHRGLGHACAPGAVMGWTKLVYDEVPESWLLSIPGFSFELGFGLSPRSKALIPEALHRIETWLSRCSEPVLVINEEEA